jgi:hypothetical protein
VRTVRRLASVKQWSSPADGREHDRFPSVSGL